MPINGRRYAWEDITINLPHGIAIDIEEISYEDERKVSRTFGRGSRAQGYSRGNYTAKGSLTMLREEYERMVAQMSNGKYDADPFPITISYANDSEDTITDTLEDCVFANWKTGGKQDDESVKIQMDFEILGDILDNGRTPFRQTGTGAGGGATTGTTTTSNAATSNSSTTNTGR